MVGKIGIITAAMVEAATMVVDVVVGSYKRGVVPTARASSRASALASVWVARKLWGVG